MKECQGCGRQCEGVFCPDCSENDVDLTEWVDEWITYAQEYQ